jgi:AraC-like DNA-binding protein
MHGRSSDPTDRPPGDPLSEVLQDLRLSGVSYGRCELTRPWGIDFPARPEARFHFVADGECWLRVPPLGWTQLRAGDAALIPRGTAHAMADAAHEPTAVIDDLPVEEIGDRFYDLRAGGGGSRTMLCCCSVSFEEPALHPLLELMPPVLLVRGAGSDDATLPALLDAMAAEVTSHRVGTATILTRLADVVITRVIRAWVEAESRSDETTGWLVAIRDPQIGRALAALHRRPGQRWSVETLAEVANTSRSIFAERFAAVVGMSPVRYLARWRMRLATLWLRDPRITVAEVAARLGYESEASFSRAYKRLLGVPPSAVRAERDAPGDEHSPSS